MHLIPSEDDAEENRDINANVFRNLDSPVSEGGENFSTGYGLPPCLFPLRFFTWFRHLIQ